jgi:hypothetical protein
MRQVIAALLVITTTVAPALAGKTTTIRKNHKKQTITCKAGDEVAIAGNQDKITTVGPCAKVTVSGNKNMVTIDSAGEIEAMGNDNKVTWKQGLDGKDASVSNLGNHNDVTQTK